MPGDGEGSLLAQQNWDSAGLTVVLEKLWHKQFRDEPLPQAWLVEVLGIIPLVTTLHRYMAAWGQEDLGRRAVLLYLFSLGKAKTPSRM